MNVIREIIRLLHCDEATAERVRLEMDCSGLDFSACTVREFNRCCRECYDALQVVREDMAAYIDETVAMRAAELKGWRWSAKHQGFINERERVTETRGPSARGVHQTQYRVAATVTQACWISGISNLQAARALVAQHEVVA
jgi:hypothetical protein